MKSAWGVALSVKQKDEASWSLDKPQAEERCHFETSQYNVLICKRIFVRNEVVMVVVRNKAKISLSQQTGAR